MLRSGARPTPSGSSTAAGFSLETRSTSAWIERTVDLSRDATWSERPLFARALIAREPRQHVHSVRVCFLPQLRDKRVRDALRNQRLERGELGAFPFPTHCGSLPQLIADGHVRPPRRAIRRDDSPNHRRLGQHRVLRPSNELCANSGATC